MLDHRMNYINADGDMDAITIEELQAIERTGRCSWQRYSIAPTVWYPHRAKMSALVMAMDERPEPSEPGERPVQHPPPPPVPERPVVIDDGWVHWKGDRVAMCSEERVLRGVSRKNFIALDGDPMRCPECIKRLEAMAGEGMPWMDWEVKLLMDEWPYAGRRKLVMERLGRSYYACRSKHYKEREYLG
jgi:hypothetical protein